MASLRQPSPAAATAPLFDASDNRKQGAKTGTVLSARRAVASTTRSRVRALFWAEVEPEMRGELKHLHPRPSLTASCVSSAFVVIVQYRHRLSLTHSLPPFLLFPILALGCVAEPVWPNRSSYPFLPLYSSLISSLVGGPITNTISTFPLGLHFSFPFRRHLIHIFISSSLSQFLSRLIVPNRTGLIPSFLILFDHL